MLGNACWQQCRVVGLRKRWKNACAVMEYICRDYLWDQTLSKHRNGIAWQSEIEEILGDISPYVVLIAIPIPLMLYSVSFFI